MRPTNTEPRRGRYRVIEILDIYEYSGDEADFDMESNLRTDFENKDKNDKIDPLTRIQQEIAEVKRREQEYRQLAATASSVGVDYEKHNGNNNNNNNINEDIHDNEHDIETESHNESISISPMPPNQMNVAATVTKAHHQQHHEQVEHHEDHSLVSNTPSLTSSVNSKDSLDEQHSDDSGISASGPGSRNKTVNDNLKLSVKEQRYIGPNCYTPTPEPPRQKLMTRTVSTPHLAVKAKSRQFTFGPAQKGVMQRFIASRGKLQLNSNAGGGNGNNAIYLNGKNAAAFLQGTTPLTAPAASTLAFSFGSPIVDPAATLSPPVVERDNEGRPIRPGYVPAEVKIQRELKNLKLRESELKKLRKMRQSTPDLLDSIDNENVDTEDSDTDEEHCYPPGKLRSAKSISELCESYEQYSTSISPSSNTPSPDMNAHQQHQQGHSSVRPAVSLAQLCDLPPEEAPSSHRLIAQWESLIQQNA